MRGVVGDSQSSTKSDHTSEAAGQSATNAHKINHPHPRLSLKPLAFQTDVTLVGDSPRSWLPDWSDNCFLIVGDPRKMFTDSSFYSAKHHPTVADQVEMAHKLSSAMFNEKNKWVK